METTLTFRSKTDGSLQEIQCPANGRITVGRGPDSPIALDGPGISREHLAIESDGQGLAITDLSSNGTWINGTRIPRGQKCKVASGDAIEIPGYEVAFKPQAGQATSATAAGAGSQPALRAVPASLTRKSPPSSFPSSLRTFASSFTRLEMFTSAVAIASLAFAAAYFLG